MKYLMLLYGLAFIVLVGCSSTKQTQNQHRPYYYVKAYTTSQMEGHKFLDSWGYCSKPEKQEDGTVIFINYNGGAKITLPANLFLVVEETQ